MLSKLMNVPIPFKCLFSWTNVVLRASISRASWPGTRKFLCILARPSFGNKHWKAKNPQEFPWIVDFYDLKFLFKLSLSIFFPWNAIAFHMQAEFLWLEFWKKEKLKKCEKQSKLNATMNGFVFSNRVISNLISILRLLLSRETHPVLCCFWRRYERWTFDVQKKKCYEHESRQGLRCERTVEGWNPEGLSWVVAIRHNRKQWWRVNKSTRHFVIFFGSFSHSLHFFSHVLCFCFLPQTFHLEINSISSSTIKTLLSTTLKNIRSLTIMSSLSSLKGLKTQQG